MTWQGRLAAVLAGALFICATGVATAQVSNTGTIEVIVEDSGGARIPGATVTATAVDTVTKRTTVSDGQGVATLDALAPSTQYAVTVELSGFQNQTRDAVLVRAGQTASVRFALVIAGVAEAVNVTAESPIIDTKSATTGQDITLQLTESLPTGRSYQSYLQLVPGVMIDNQEQSTGNPAARSGMNYSDVGGELGISTDNVYYFDGINVTDPVVGTFGANLNTEIIQEMRVTTGGTPAEYVGAAGLIANVVTKSGSDQFHGSANYYWQSTDLFAENENGAGQDYSSDDTAFTFGGPALRNKAWFFGSYRYLNRTDNVISLDTEQFLRKVENKQHQNFAKGTWAATADDLISFTYLGDPTEISGRRERDITNGRDFAREQGGHRYGANYSRVWGNTLLDVAASKHNGEVTNLSPERRSRVDVLFRSADDRTISQEQGGAYGRDLIDQRDNMSVRGSLQHVFGMHTVKGGLVWEQHDNFRDTLYVDNTGFYSLAPQYAGQNVTAAQLAQSGAFSNRQFTSTNASDFNGFMNTINGRADRQRFYNAFDTNGDGTITSAELGTALRFNTLGADGLVAYDRDFQVATGPQDTRSRGLSFYIQDQISLNRLTVNVGVRTERWNHYATTGEDIYTFDWSWAPRISATYDILGNGKHKASFYYGRYYDPIRNDMTNFAGTLTGSIIEEQVFALGEYVTYRTRGGPVVQDAFFAPTTKTPYTDDIEVGYGVDLGNNMSFDALYINRRTRDIFEDYDLSLYAEPDGYIGVDDHGDPNAPDSLFLGYDYFGYTENPGSNFVIGTLAGGKRDWQGVELVLRKRFANRWQLLTSYNWADAEGNSNSDGDADFQGDVLYLDPRAPNQFGTQPGLIRHTFKGAASYTFPFRLLLGGVVSWNSGTYASLTELQSSRHTPIAVHDPFVFGGVLNNWIEPGAVGGVKNPSWGQVDLRAQYTLPLGPSELELFTDIFNLFNKQSVITTQDLVAGQGGVAFGEAKQWVQPLRAFLGARVKF